MTKDSDIREVVAELRLLATKLEGTLGFDSKSFYADDELPVFDPDIDMAPVTPKVRGEQVQEDWCGLLLWARLQSINIRQGRGATKAEVVQIAKDSGYKDGRGWNKWTGWSDTGDSRWVEEAGVDHLRTYYRKVGRSLPPELDKLAKH